MIEQSKFSMGESLLTKETIQKLLEFKGQSRGAVFQTDAEYFLKKRGRESLKRLESRLGEIGCNIDYGKISSMSFYPTAWRVVSFLFAQEVLGLSDEEIREMGRTAPKISLVIKFFLKYFVSIRIIANQIPAIWRKHHSAGDLEVTELDEEKGRIVLRLTGADLHPLFCTYLTGYFSTIGQMVVGQPVEVQEIRCSFRGGTWHEYLIRWKVPASGRAAEGFLPPAETLDRKIAEELMKLKGEVRGVALKDDFEYVLATYGPEGVKRVEDTLADAGLAIRYREIKAMTFYPLGYDGAIQLAVKKTFKMSDEELEKMGEALAKISSLFTKLMMSLISLERAAAAAPGAWQRHYREAGQVKIVRLSREEKMLILRLENFRLHPVYCKIFTGFLVGIIRMLVKKPVVCRETSCLFRGNLYHEFLITWQG